MYCSSSVTVHLLRGLAALVLLVFALFFNPYGMVLSAAALVGAVVLLRGCPMCWMMGLFETIRKGKDRGAISG
jgi:hypothetical protein